MSDIFSSIGSLFGGGGGAGVASDMLNPASTAVFDTSGAWAPSAVDAATGGALASLPADFAGASTSALNGVLSGAGGAGAGAGAGAGTASPMSWLGGGSGAPTPLTGGGTSVTAPAATPIIPASGSTATAGTGTAGGMAPLDPNAMNFDPNSATVSGGGGGGQLSATAGAPKSSFLSQILGHGGKSGILPEVLGAGALGLDLFKGSQTSPQVKALEQMAGQDKGLVKSYTAQAQAEGQGLLPAGLQAGIQQNLDAAIAGIKSRYATMDMTGSTMEAQDIAAAERAAFAETASIGQSLAQQGLNEVTSASGQEMQLLQAILAANTAQGTDLGNTLAEFARYAATGTLSPPASTPAAAPAA